MPGLIWVILLQKRNRMTHPITAAEYTGCQPTINRIRSNRTGALRHLKSEPLTRMASDPVGVFTSLDFDFDRWILRSEEACH
jgi:hypothetical protein